MFCKYCGSQIDDDSIFCSKCGKNLNSSSSSNNEKTKVVSEHSSLEERKGIACYLENLIYLELIKNRLERIQVILNSTHRSLLGDKLLPAGQFRVDYKLEPYRGYSLVAKEAHGPFVILKRIFDELAFSFTNEYTGLCFSATRKGFKYKDEKVLYGYLDVITFANMERFTNEVYVDSMNQIQNYHECNWRYCDCNLNKNNIFPNGEMYTHRLVCEKTLNEEQLDVVRHFQSEFIKCYEDFDSLCKYIKPFKSQSEINSIQQKIDEIDKLLKESYALNIIPGQYRNLASVYYIHDYFTTSNESLSDILYHLDLENINKHFDEVIANQRNSLIHQAINNAQNQELIAQNNEMLEKLALIDAGQTMGLAWSAIAGISSGLNGVINTLGWT